MILLPASITRPDQWVRWALERWRHRAPDRFTGLRAWTNDPRWQTYSESIVTRQRKEFDDERACIVADLERRDQEIAEAAAAAEHEAAGGPRRLLTDDGDTLKAAVIEALTVLGFDVVDADTLPERRGRKREDLQVRDPGDGDWVAIAEVKGHTGGAQAGVLVAIGRAAELYQREHEVASLTRWYVVNPERNLDPSTRDVPFASDTDALEHFADLGGAVVDTRTLFTLQKRYVGASDDTRQLLRNQLKATTGLWPITTAEVWSP